MNKSACALRALFGLELLSWGLLFVIDVTTLPAQLTLMADPIPFMPLWTALGVLITFGFTLSSLVGVVRGAGLSSFIDGTFYVVALIGSFLFRVIVWLFAMGWITTVNGMQSV